MNRPLPFPSRRRVSAAPEAEAAAAVRPVQESRPVSVPGAGGRRSLVLCLLLAACSSGPDFRRPELAVPETWKAAGEWKPAALHRGSSTRWWQAFGDERLAALVDRVAIDNQNVVAAAAQWREARAALAVADAARQPLVAGSFAESRLRSGDAAPVREDRLALSASWEADLWGRLGRAVEAGRAGAAAGEADHAAALLSAQAAVVQTHIQLRHNAVQHALAERTLAAQTRFLELTRHRHAAGVASRADVSQAETQLLGVEAQRLELRLARAQFEHALAVLVGQAPAAFTPPAGDPGTLPEPPAIPPRLPSELLERRPDIAAAEARVAAANARIGVASGAWFPSLSLGAGGGWSGPGLAGLIRLPNRFWSFGPSLALTLLDAGQRSAQQDEAVAAWERSVANYRQTVLNALREVEDQLAAGALLEREAVVQRAAARAAAEALALALDQYAAGTVGSLNVLSAQAASLAAERAVADVAARRLLAAVALTTALGGDWGGMPPR